MLLIGKSILAGWMAEVGSLTYASCTNAVKVFVDGSDIMNRFHDDVCLRVERPAPVLGSWIEELKETII